ncbi:glycosyltransferase [Leptolyngbya sp. NIES-2104]|uniref:glycosyltransferase n=1 Tax=Leptolyngbya sp. NIES-2104 TaxID=1552121 RepID=UPI0006EC4F41|nr:glycosyltransferase [Leptolyngbya sp. NIES-2104]GAP97588.1 glycosyltransferase [Leptolyngbya sp. NIES-2104]
MRVLVVAPYVATTYGGPGKVVVELTQALAQFDIEVDLVTTNANVDTPLDVPLQVWHDREGYRVQYFPSWNQQDLIWSTSLLTWLFQHVREYDIVHTHCLFMPIASATNWICRWHRVPFVMTPHGMLEPWALSQKAWKKRLYYTAIEQPTLKQAKAIHVLTPIEAGQVKSLGLNQTVVVPNGIHRREFESLPDVELFYQQFPQTRDKVLILFLGRLDPKKGLDLLAPAFAAIHQQFPQTHLVVAGPDLIGYLPTAQTFFADLNLTEQVTFTGMLSGKLKLSALAAASVYVCPSYSEGFSMSVLEGMAAGLPCVVTEACNFAEAAQVAYIVQATSSAIADALSQAIVVHSDARHTGYQAQQFVFQNYTWERSAAKLLKAYRTTAL